MTYQAPAGRPGGPAGSHLIPCFALPTIGTSVTCRLSPPFRAA